MHCTIRSILYILHYTYYKAMRRHQITREAPQKPPGATRSHQEPPGATGSHQEAPGPTRTHQDPPGPTRPHRQSLASPVYPCPPTAPYKTD